MAVRWHTVFTLSWVPRKSYGGLTASLWRPHGALTAAVRQTCNSCKNREVAVRSPPGLLAVTLRFLISWIVRSSCGRRNICDHNYRRPQDLTIFKNQVLQTVDRRTVRWPYGGSMICALFSKHDIKISVVAYLSLIYSYLLDPVDFVLDWDAYINHENITRFISLLCGKAGYK